MPDSASETNTFLPSCRKTGFVDIIGKTYPVLQTTESIQDDKGRDALLKSEGYKVHRIQARDIFEKPAVVIDDIKKKLEIIDSKI